MNHSEYWRWIFFFLLTTDKMVSVITVNINSVPSTQWLFQFSFHALPRLRKTVVVCFVSRKKTDASQGTWISERRHWKIDPVVMYQSKVTFCTWLHDWTWLGVEEQFFLTNTISQSGKSRQPLLARDGPPKSQMRLDRQARFFLLLQAKTREMIRLTGSAF